MSDVTDRMSDVTDRMSDVTSRIAMIRIISTNAINTNNYYIFEPY